MRVSGDVDPHAANSATAPIQVTRRLQGTSETKADTTAAAARPSSFHTVLSELNPLQYLPVIGTVYRSLTGDTIPEPVRLAGSLIVSGLLGGPVGIAMSLAALGVEKATGLDPERIGHAALASVGIGTAEPVAVAAPPADAVPAPPADATAAPAPAPIAWSPSQLAAYGVTTTANGALSHGALAGSDVLNDLELARLGTVPPATQAASLKSNPVGDDTPRPG